MPVTLKRADSMLPIRVPEVQGTWGSDFLALASSRSHDPTNLMAVSIATSHMHSV